MTTTHLDTLRRESPRTLLTGAAEQKSLLFPNGSPKIVYRDLATTNSAQQVPILKLLEETKGFEELLNVFIVNSGNYFSLPLSHCLVPQIR